MKKIYLHIGVIAALLISSTTATAQQYSKLWLWQQNAFSISPALIGLNPGVDVSAYYANNFSKLDNSLTNMGVMASGQLANTNAGMGVNLSRESIGFENVFNGTVAYNYGVKLNNNYSLKFGLSLGIIHHQTDAAVFRKAQKMRLHRHVHGAYYPAHAKPSTVLVNNLLITYPI